MEHLSDQLNKCTSDKHIYKFLFKIRANFINNAADIDKLLKQKFVGYLATVLGKRIENSFELEENIKIIDVLLSILANCTYNNKTAATQVYDENIKESLMTIINKSENGILMAKTCRLIGNLVQSEKIGISFQQAGVALSLSNCLSEKSTSMLITMSLRAIRLMWNSRKFRSEILSLGTIFKIISCLRNTLKSEFKGNDASEVETVSSTMVILKTDSAPDRLISKQKLSSILTKMETQNVETKYEILRPEKINYEFAIPTSKDNLELITGLLKLLLTITGTSTLMTQIAKNVYADGLGIECLLFLIEESPKFRVACLKILSNLSFSSNSQEFLGINNELIPTISNLLMNIESLELNEQKYCLEILCLSTENSCNRLKLKRSGVFKILLSIASTSKIRDELNLLIFLFFHYRYDEDSLNLLIQLNLINVLLKLINDIIENKQVDHIKVDDSDKDRMDDHKTKQQKKRVNTEPLQFGGYTKFMRFESNSPSSSGYGSYQYSPSRSSSDGFSPYNSPQRCYQDYNSDSNEYSPVCSDNEENCESVKKQDKEFDILDFIYNNDEIGRSDDVKEQQKVIGDIEDETTSLTINDNDSDDDESTKMETPQSSSNSCGKNLPEILKSIEADNLQYILLLLWKVSINHSDALAFVNAKNLSILIKVFSLVKKPHEKIYQILQNILEQTRNFVPIFMRQDFLFQIYDTANTYYDHFECYSCDKMKLTGLQLLKDFRKVAEGGYGNGQISDSLLQGEMELKRKVAIKLTYVISSPDILNKFLFNYGALDIIMDTIYSNDEFLSVAACNGITILSNNLNIRIPSEDDVFQRIIPDEFELKNFNEESNKEQVKFILKDGDALFEKDILMTSSEVFNSMFSGDFRESNKNEVKFPNYTVLGMKYFFQLVKMSKEKKLKPIAPKIDNMDVVLQAYELSILYIMMDIQQPLLNIIKVILDESNVKRIFEWSIRNINQDLLISSICYYLCGAIDGKTKLKLYLEVKESQYSKEFKDLIFDSILMKCKPVDD